MSDTKFRWLAPAAALVLALATPAAFAAVANADSALPDKTAQQLLEDIAAAEPVPFSGQVTQTAELGLPDLSALTDLAGMQGPHSLAAPFDPMMLASGTNTWRVWTNAADSAKVALVVDGGEYSVTTNGTDLWLWDSAAGEATHGIVPDHQAPTTDVPQITPGELAEKVLAELDPTTEVTTSGTRVVAGRAAYELVLTPDSPETRVGEVRLAVDGENSMVLALSVSNKAGLKAVDVAFTSIDYTAPNPEIFQFSPPPGATVTELPEFNHDSMMGDGATQPDTSTLPQPTVIGESWTTVVVLPDLTSFSTAMGTMMGETAIENPMDKMPEALREQVPAGMEEQLQAEFGAGIESVIAQLPAVSGEWGSGKLFEGTLVTVVLSDDGRVAFGAVAPELLYRALAG